MLTIMTLEAHWNHTEWKCNSYKKKWPFLKKVIPIYSTEIDKNDKTSCLKYSETWKCNIHRDFSQKSVKKLHHISLHINGKWKKKIIWTTLLFLTALCLLQRYCLKYNSPLNFTVNSSTESYLLLLYTVTKTFKNGSYTCTQDCISSGLANVLSKKLLLDC